MAVQYTTGVFKPLRRRTHLTVERIDGEALASLIRKKDTNPNEVARKAGLGPRAIYSYVNGEQLLADSKSINKIADILNVDPIEFILCPGEGSTVFKRRFTIEQPTEDVKAKPDPVFVVGDKYHIRNKNGKSFIDGFFKHMGTAPGNDCTHYMFMNTPGKWIMTLTKVDVDSPDLVIEPTKGTQVA